MIPETITFLQPAASRQSARKVHRLRETAAGTTLETTAYANGKQFRHQTDTVADIEQLYETLKFRAQLNCFAIRGAVRPGAADITNRRHKGPDAGILDVPSRVVAVDLDTEEAPPWLDTDDILAVGDFLRSRLPPELQGVSCVVQLSAGYGLWRWKAGPRWLKARLWFLNDEPLDSAQLRRWFREQNESGQYAQMDEAVAGCNQPIYTATPEFIGFDDPIPTRWALLLGESDVASIRAPAAPERPQPVAVAVGSAPRNPGVLGVCVRMIEAAQDGEKHTVLNRAAYLAGGFVGAGGCTEMEARTALQEAISRKAGVADLQAAFATIEQALQDGQRAPVAGNPADDATTPTETPATAATTEDAKPFELSGAYPSDLEALRSLKPGKATLDAALKFVRRHFWRCPWRVSLAKLEQDIVEAAPLYPKQRRILARTIVRLAGFAQRSAAEPTALDVGTLRAAGVEVVEVATIEEALAAVQAAPWALNLAKAGLGTGKTERVLKPLADAAQGTVVAITNRVSLVSDLCKRLHLANYQTTATRDIAVTTALGVCLKSIMNPKFGDPLARASTVLIDEIAAAVKECHAPAGVLGKGAKATWARLCDLLRRTPVATGVDADLSTADVLALHTEMQGRAIRVIVVRPEPTPITAEIGDSKQVWTAILAAIKKGEPCRIFSDSAGQVRKLAALISELYPDKRILAIHSANGVATTGDPAVQAALADINHAAHHLDVLLHSPSVESGVSLTVPHFTRSFGIYCGKVTPAAFIQMMRRDRTATHFEIGILSNGVRWDETNPGAILNNMDATHRRTVEIATLEGRYLLETTPATPWDDRVTKYQASRNKATNLYAQGLWLLLEAMGAKVKLPSDGPVDGSVLAAAADLSKEQYREAILNARDISADERDAIETTYQPTPEQSAEAARYDCAETLATPIDGDALDVWNEGKVTGAVRRFEASQSAPLAGLAQDAADDAAEIPTAARSNRLAEAEAIRTALEVLGFDPATGDGEITAASVREAFENLKASPVRASLEHFGLMRFDRKPAQPVRWVGYFLAKLGLALGELHRVGGRGEQVRVYSIRRGHKWDRAQRWLTAPGWDEMCAIYERRAARATLRQALVADVLAAYSAPCASR